MFETLKNKRGQFLPAGFGHRNRQPGFDHEKSRGGKLWWWSSDNRDIFVNLEL